MKPVKLLSLLLVTLAITVSVAGWWYYYRTPDDIHHESVHYHAGFQVYVDDVKQDYSDWKYMNFTPCGDHQEKQTPEEEQQEKAHLHDGNGDVVHVHRPGATWGDLFKNIGVTLDANKEVVAYSGDQKITDILTKPIEANQSIVIVVGAQEKANEYLPNRVTLERIAEVEKKSELCGATKH
ncbi:MAG TPA: hypothetical protein VD999_03535 [Vitreimonas sp.]|nr:hypothetical protein [Vitreimonas sp.]